MDKKPVVATITRINGAYSLIDKNIVELIPCVPSYDSSQESMVRILTGENEHLYIGMPSINCFQDNKLAQFFKLRDAGINTPNVIYSNAAALMMKHMKFDKKYVLKPVYGARSIGQMVVDVEKYNKLTDDVYNVNITREMFNAKHNVDTGKCVEAGEEFELHNSLSVGTVSLSEFKNVKSEYRVIAFAGYGISSWIYEKRQGYLAGSKEERKHEVVPFNTLEIELISDLLPKMETFITAHQYPFLAFDIYIAKDGETGVFEFDPYGFGVDYPINTLKYLRECLTNSLHKKLMILQQGDTQHA